MSGRYEWAEAEVQLVHECEKVGAAIDWNLNVLDIAMLVLTVGILGVTILITTFVRSWDRQNLQVSLLWETCKEHWRTAVALEENSRKVPTKQFPKAEVDVRVVMIERTGAQIRLLEGASSTLADAFEAVSRIKDWSISTPDRIRAVEQLTTEMKRSFSQ